MSPAARGAPVLIVLAGLGFVLLAWWLVPWAWLPDGAALPPVSPAQVLDRAQLGRLADFTTMQRYLSWASYAVSALVALALGLTRTGSRIVSRLPGPWWSQAVTVLWVVLLLRALATLPLDAWLRGRAMRVDLTQQSWPAWFSDQGLALLVASVVTGIGVLVVVGLARRAPRTWPWWAAALSGVFVVAGSYLWPLAVEPLFNDFHELPAGPLRASVMRLAAREHVQIDSVLVADASRRTTALNAYVSGFGDTRRVELYDTLIEDAPRDQVEVVVAHELAHAAHDDQLVGTVLAAVGTALGVGLLGELLTWPWLLRRAGVSAPGDPRVVPLMMALMALGTFFASPVENTISRSIEARADLEALRATDAPTSFVAMQRRLVLKGWSDPDPPRLSQIWFGSHPTLLQRVGIAEAFGRLERNGGR